MQIKWKYKEDGNSEWCWCYVGEYRIFVMDCDGDFSYFTVTRKHLSDTVHSSPTYDGCGEYYHFDVAKSAAEIYIRTHLLN